MKCWGKNSSGQAGGGTPSSKRVISETAGSPLASNETAIAIAAGWSHTCAILSDKSVKCWGSNASRQAGGGTPSNKRVVSETAGSPLASDETATAIAVGSYHTCVILSNNKVKCWGSNFSGQAGGGTQNSSNTLVISETAGSPLASNETAIAITAGHKHTCAIL